MTGLVYALIRVLLRVALAVYYSRIEVEGDEDVPDGPIVLAATHPNAFVDVALVATRLPRRVHFVAKAPLFENPIRRFVLSTMGAVPVERRQDRGTGELEAGAKEKNAQSLAACEAVVAGGGAVLIFPEGTSEHVPRLLPLKTGVARIALGAAARGAPEVQIVPVAVRYDDPTRFRSRARVQFLPAIPVAPFIELHAKDPQDAVRALTGAVREQLEPSVVHAEAPELAELVPLIDQLYGRHLTAARGGAARLAAAPAIALAVNEFARSAPERVALVREKLARYGAALRDAGLGDATVRGDANRPSPGQTIALVAGAPVAAVGALHHVLPYQVPKIITGLFIRDPASVAGVKLIVGCIVFPALWVGAGFGYAWLLGSLAAGVAIGCALPFTGIIALEVIDAVKARLRRRRRRLARRRTPPETLRELQRLRADIVGELERARAEFLLARAEPAPEGLD